MSYTHIHLPDKNTLEREFIENPERIKLYAKYDSYIGSNESLQYLKEQTKLHNESILNIGYKNEGLAS